MLFSLTYALFIIIIMLLQFGMCTFYLGKHYLLIRVHKVVAFVEYMCKLPSCAMIDKVHQNGMYMYNHNTWL